MFLENGLIGSSSWLFAAQRRRRKKEAIFVHSESRPLVGKVDKT
jgi:hypothetical protein